MYKTQSNQLRKIDKSTYNLLRKLCWHSARLYNVALYSIRQTYFDTKTYLAYPQNYHACKTNENYEIMPSVMAQQTLKVADRSFKSFFALIKAKQKNKYAEKINMPQYLKPNSYFQLIIPKNGFQIKGDKIHIGISRQLKKNNTIQSLIFDFPTQIDASKVQEIRIVPQHKATFFKMEVIYEVNIQNLKLKRSNILSIDVGVNNLATCYDVKKNRAFILDGKKIKSINYFWNKETARLQSIYYKQGGYAYTKKQFILKQKRTNKIKDIMRKSANYIVNYCIENNIGTIIIGHNKGWKKEINIGRINNLNFYQIPFGYLMTLLSYKCKEYMINYVEIQESHTSKCSAIDEEDVKYHSKYQGRRICRGLFKSKKGNILNADVNGAINIARKSKVSAIQFTVERIRGIVAYPIRIKVV